MTSSSMRIAAVARWLGATRSEVRWHASRYSHALPQSDHYAFRHWTRLAVESISGSDVELDNLTDLRNRFQQSAVELAASAINCTLSNTPQVPQEPPTGDGADASLESDFYTGKRPLP